VKPSIGRVVHYVSYGTPGGEYPSACRAAIVTAVDDYQTPATNDGGAHIGHVSLCVLNPEGMFFNRAVLYHDGAETPGSPDCPNIGRHADLPHRYCACGWMEATPKGGTWHWPERVE
jgi:hypothetical protein